MNERIKKLRKALGLTQQEFSKRLNIGRGTLANYEVGRNEPIDAVISLICHEFNVDETWLRTGEGEMFQKPSDSIVKQLAAEFGLNDFLQSVVSEFLKLNADQRKIVREFVYNIASEMIPAAVAPAAQAADQPDQHAIWEAEARAEAEEYYREILEEKKRAANGSASSGSDTSGTA